MRGRLAWVGLGVMATLVLADVALRFAGTPDLLSRAGSFVTALVAAALGCIAGLMVRRSADAALIWAGAASALAALDITGIAQAERLALDPGAWRPWLAAAELALVAAAFAGATALAAASRPVRLVGSNTRSRLVGSIAFAGFLLVAALSAWSAAQAPVVVGGVADAGAIRTSGRAALGFAAAALAVAVGLASSAPLQRARTAAARAPGGSGRGRIAAFGNALFDEVVLGRTRRRVADAERARLAADIHARLLPGLRRAAVVAAGPDVPESVGASLRAAVADAQSLMDTRESVVLDSFGIVAALEWLAERTEALDGVEVTLDLDEVTLDLDEAGDASDLPAATARAVFRIALLAVDNAIRHGRPRRIDIALQQAATSGRLTVRDDGVGIGATEVTAPVSQDGRGLRDMAAAAASIGGTLMVTPAAPGTRVDLAWQRPAVAGNHPAPARVSTDGPPTTAR